MVVHMSASVTKRGEFSLVFTSCKLHIILY